MTNRELFFLFKKESEDKVSETEINEILLYVNNFKDFTELIINFNDEVKNEEKAKSIFNRVKNGEFLAYILGKTTFLDKEIIVNKSTLIPRPETSELILKSINYINEYKIKHNKIADICTGSGIIALFLKENFIKSTVYATDFYKETLETAKLNFKNNNLKINTFLGDKTKPFIENNIKLDVLISNPPYVKNMDDIEEKVKNNEPLHAIYTPKGIEFYEDYFKNADILMNEKYFMAFEINYDQEEVLTELIKKYLKNVYYIFEKDYYDLIRFLFIFKGYKI